MFAKMLSVEWTRLSRRAIMWIALALSVLYIGLNQTNFYTANKERLLSGDERLPGFSFDLATPLDQVDFTVVPFLIIIAGSMMGSDYQQRTNQHWLMRLPRWTSVLAKFSLLVVWVYIIHVLALLTGGLIGFGFKQFMYDAFTASNVNWAMVILGPSYMTLVTLPYIALAILLATVTRSTWLSVALGLGYTVVMETLLASIFYEAGWTKWLLTNVHESTTYLLNSMGNLSKAPPAWSLNSVTAIVVAVAYTVCMLVAAIIVLRQQDVGG
jgi:ABC-2 family transporter protein